MQSEEENPLAVPAAFCAVTWPQEVVRKKMDRTLLRRSKRVDGRRAGVAAVCDARQ
jgi:hypothetical protein